jgi:thiamine-monophosphate kinase
MAKNGDRARGEAPLSEEALIARYFVPLAKDFPGAYGLRDDAAVIEPPSGHDLVVTTDALVAGVHFFPDDVPADIAWKALAVNVSDLAAKGATPLAYSLALALPPPPSAEFLAGFAAGLGEAQARFGTLLCGGDTTSTRGETMISITAFGTVPPGQALRRGNARPGDSLYISGTVGDAALGLKLRRGDAETAGWPVGEDARHWLIRRYLRPEPRLALAPALLAHASAAMDVSDGLGLDCRRLCIASGLAAKIEAAAIPFAAQTLPLVQSPDLLRIAITGGDDYEILAAIRPGEEAAFETAAAIAGIPVTRIGVLAAGAPAVTISAADGAPIDVGGHGGYEHFRS